MSTPDTRTHRKNTYIGREVQTDRQTREAQKEKTKTNDEKRKR